MPSPCDPDARHRLIRTIGAVSESRQRAFLWVETLTAAAPESAVQCVRAVLTSGWTETDPTARLLLETAMFALAIDAWPEEHRRASFEAALASDDRLVSLMIGSDYLYDAPVSELNLPVPTYRTDRVLTLGERKSLARRPDRAGIALALRDPHPAVIEKLLDNPRLTEQDALFIAAARPLTPEIPSCLGRHPKWRLSPRVAAALVHNPHTVLGVVLSLLHNLGRPAAAETARVPSLAPPIREALLDLLRLSA